MSVELNTSTTVSMAILLPFHSHFEIVKILVQSQANLNVKNIASK